MPKKKLNKDTLHAIKRMVEQEARLAEGLYNVLYEFHEYSAEVQTVYVRELLESPNSVEHHMLEDLFEKVKKLNPRYRVGILFTDVPDFDEDEEEF